MLIKDVVAHPGWSEEPRLSMAGYCQLPFFVLIRICFTFATKIRSRSGGLRCQSPMAGFDKESRWSFGEDHVPRVGSRR